MRAETLFPGVFNVSNKFTPVPSRQDLKRELCHALRKLCAAMAKHGLLDANRASTYLTDELLDRMIARCLPSGTVSKLDVLKTLKPLSKWVVMPLDKDTGSTYLMCPALYWARLDQLYSTSLVNYAELPGPQTTLATELVSAVESTDTVLPAAAPRGDEIPYAYLLPKAKDPANKDRPLISYFRHPNKRKLKCVGRALMWLLKQLQISGAVNSFSTFDTRDYASRMRKLGTLPPNTAVYLGDVKNMYTNIEHTALLEVVAWVLTLVATHFGNDAQVFVPNASSAKPTWSADAPGSRPGVHVTLDTMQTVLEYDITHIYFRLGNKLLRQCLGVPMGSPCSPALAIALCMHAEHAFMQAHPGVRVHAGFRYVDDLLLFLESSGHESLIDNIYPSPLELEREDTTPVNGRVCFRFLETWNVLDASGSISVIHYHKNSHQLRLGKPPFKNVVDFSSHTPRHQKFGRVVGALTAAHAHTVSNADRCGAMHVVLQDMQRYGMPAILASAALTRMRARLGRAEPHHLAH
jgi:hypothetical protein